MINEDRVRQMTKLAMFEEKQQRKYQPMLHYNKKDYLTLKSMGAFIAGSLFYLLAFMLLCAVLFATSIDNLHYVTIVIILVGGLALYIIYLYFYIRSVRKRGSKEYNQGTEMIKNLQSEYEK